MVKPYTDEQTPHGWIRTFDLQRDEEYVWHRDKNDRIVKIIEIEGVWKFQYDNQMPFIINKNDTISIDKMVWHRLIPGSGQMRILINENI